MTLPNIYSRIVRKLAVPTTLRQPSSLHRTLRSFYDDPRTLSKLIAEANKEDRKQQPQRKRKKGSQKPSYRFIDRIKLQAIGGQGGQGAQSVLRLKRKGGRRPDGGHGGHGGAVVLLADPTVQSLAEIGGPVIRADPGAHGTSQEQGGKRGRNAVVRIPCGVVVRQLAAPVAEVLGDLNDGELVEWKDDDGGGGGGGGDEVGEQEESGDEEEDWNTDGTEDDDDDDDTDNDEEDTDNEEDTDDYSTEEDKENAIHENNVDTSGDEAELLDNDSQSTDNDHTQAHADDFPEDDGEWHNDFDAFVDTHQTPVTKVTPNPRGEYLADLDKPGTYLVVARGGRGGTGSMYYKNFDGAPPSWFKLYPPKPGEVVHLELELKMIADVGLVGFPNAGKSSLLRAMSRATPEVAPYPFTTLHPLMGIVEYRDGMQIKVADIPGLIAGASQGRGKGIDFLRHVERTKALCYMLDVAGTEGRDPHEDLRVLVDELSSYADGTLLERNALVVANKIDLIEPARLESLLMSVQETADSLGILRWSPVHGISAGVSGHGLGALSKDIRSIIEHFESEEKEEKLWQQKWGATQDKAVT